LCQCRGRRLGPAGTFRLGSTVVRSATIDVFHSDNDARVIAFRRWDDTGELLVVGSLNNSPFNSPGYTLSYGPLGDWGWRECLNSDASEYGGWDVGNLGATLRASGGQLTVVIPRTAPWSSAAPPERSTLCTARVLRFSSTGSRSSPGIR